MADVGYGPDDDDFFDPNNAGFEHGFFRDSGDSSDGDGGGGHAEAGHDDGDSPSEGGGGGGDPHGLKTLRVDFVLKSLGVHEFFTIPVADDEGTMLQTFQVLSLSSKGVYTRTYKTSRDIQQPGSTIIVQPYERWVLGHDESSDAAPASLTCFVVEEARALNLLDVACDKILAWDMMESDVEGRVDLARGGY